MNLIYFLKKLSGAFLPMKLILIFSFPFTKLVAPQFGGWQKGKCKRG
jgi:hypothetical protein